MGGVASDFRYAARMLVKSPGMSALAVGALALGIGVTAVMFSIVYSALLRGLPFPDGERIVHISSTQPSRDIDQMAMSIHDFLDFRQQQTSLEGLAAYYEGTVNVRWTDRPERFDGAFITAGAFEALGVGPILGRPFQPGEDRPGAPARILLSHHIWMDRFGGDPGALGQTVKVNGEPAEIVGVMPEGFLFPNRQDVWVPLRVDALALGRGEGMRLNVYGRLRPDVTLDAALTEFSGIARRLEAAYPETNEGVGVRMKPFHLEYVGDQAGALLYTMLAVVSLVLLIACANVANLLLARAAARTREVGIRTALGAHRWRVVSGMVTEALVLALVAGVLGSGLAWMGIELFDRAVQGTNPPFFLVFQLDGPILAFIVFLSVVAAVVAGGLPALKASDLDVAGILKDESRGSSGLRIGRLSRVLVVGEIAMSMALLVAAGLMTKSITTLRDYDFGFATDDVFTARVGLFEADFPDSVARHRFFEDLEARIRDVPGVRAAGLATILPGMGSGFTRFVVDGASYAEDRDYPGALFGAAGPGYFETFGVEPVMGRVFTPSDDAEAPPVAVVNESFVRRFLGGGSPLGRRIRPGDSEAAGPWRTVVGVVPDLWMQGVGNTPDAPRAGFYVPVRQSDARFMSIVAAGPSDPMALTESIRAAVQAVHADTPIYFVDTMAGRLAENTWVFNVFGVLFMVFGGVALFLASVGLYGVMAFSVRRRTAEVGIRMALGAEAGRVLGLILRQGATQVALGVTLGLGIAVVVARGLELVLFQVKAADPAVFALVAGVLAVTGLTASLVPARRATRVDPLVALRSE